MGKENLKIPVHKIGEAAKIQKLGPALKEQLAPLFLQYLQASDPGQYRPKLHCEYIPFDKKPLEFEHVVCAYRDTIGELIITPFQIKTSLNGLPFSFPSDNSNLITGIAESFANQRDQISKLYIDHVDELQTFSINNKENLEATFVRMLYVILSETVQTYKDIFGIFSQCIENEEDIYLLLKRFSDTNANGRCFLDYVANTGQGVIADLRNMGIVFPRHMIDLRNDAQWYDPQIMNFFKHPKCGISYMGGCPVRNHPFVFDGENATWIGHQGSLLKKDYGARVGLRE